MATFSTKLLFINQDFQTTSPARYQTWALSENHHRQSFKTQTPNRPMLVFRQISRARTLVPIRVFIIRSLRSMRKLSLRSWFNNNNKKWASSRLLTNKRHNNMLTSQRTQEYININRVFQFQQLFTWMCQTKRNIIEVCKSQSALILERASLDKKWKVFQCRHHN